MKRAATGEFMPSGKPHAPIRRIADHYYVLQMADREIGGTSCSALENYARKCGFIPVERENDEIRLG